MGLKGKTKLIYIKDWMKFQTLISQLNVRFDYRNQNELELSGSYIYLKIFTPLQCILRNRNRMHYVDSSLGYLDFNEHQTQADFWMTTHQDDTYEFVNLERFKQILEEHDKTWENIHEYNRQKLKTFYSKDNDSEYVWENKSGTDLRCPECDKLFFVCHEVFEPLEEDKSLQCPHCKMNLITAWINEPKLIIKRRT